MLVGAGALHGLVQLLAQVVLRGAHQRHDHVLEVAAELALEVLDEVPAVLGGEEARDLLALRVGARRQDVDDGLLVGAEALHGGAQRGAVLGRVEVGGRAQGGRSLGTHDGLEQDLRCGGWNVEMVSAVPVDVTTPR